MQKQLSTPVIVAVVVALVVVIGAVAFFAFRSPPPTEQPVLGPADTGDPIVAPEHSGQAPG